MDRFARRCADCGLNWPSWDRYRFCLRCRSATVLTPRYFPMSSAQAVRLAATYRDDAASFEREAMRGLAEVPVIEAER